MASLFENVEDFSVPDKLRELETFMDDVIQKKVGDAQEEERQAYAQVLDIKNLLKNITELIEDEAKDLMCLTDLGGEFFVNAHVQDVSKMCAELVHGFYLEMPLDKLSAFLRKKLTIYEERHSRALERVAIAKTELRLFMRALSTVADPSLDQ